MHRSLVTALVLLVALRVTVLPGSAQQSASVEAQLCQSQLQLLQSRGKLTVAEAAVYQAQCDCLAQTTQASGSACTQPAQPPRSLSQTEWQARKCSLYQDAWTKVLDSLDLTQVNYAFIAGNENFIAADCAGADTMICPRSRAELDAANRLTLAMMNAGAASTFLPFKCPADPDDTPWQGPGL